MLPFQNVFFLHVIFGKMAKLVFIDSVSGRVTMEPRSNVLHNGSMGLGKQASPTSSLTDSALGRKRQRGGQQAKSTAALARSFERVERLGLFPGRKVSLHGNTVEHNLSWK